MFRRTSDHPQAAKLLTSQINQMHALHFIRASAITCIALLGTSSVFGQTYTLSPSPFLLAQNNSGQIINNSCIWTYTAGTSTPATTYSDASGTPNLNPIRSDSAGRFTAYLLPGSNYKFVYEAACVPPAHATVLRTADNIAAVPVSGLNVDVTGTAGESLSTGDVVYLSDGSAGLNAGQWYKADADFIYGSIGAGQIGMVPTAISSGVTSAIRIQGRVTGLAGLTIGFPHYVSATAGALTATMPTNARLVGVADSATSLVLTPNPAASLSAVAPGTCQCRMTLTTATPITVADVTAATTVRLTPYKGNRLSLYTGTFWREYAFAELSLALGTDTADTNYDMFVYDNAGTLTLERLAWTNSTTRATALVLQDGALVKTGATTRLYVGTYRTTGVAGQTEDSFAKRYVWNYYNRVRRAMRIFEATASWTYTTATIRQANAATTNQVDMVIGVAEVALELELVVVSSNTNANVNRRALIGEDSTTAAMTTTLNGVGNIATWPAAQELTHTVLLRHHPAIGRHFYAWLEISPAIGTTTWYSVPIGAGNSQSGLIGSIEG